MNCDWVRGAMVSPALGFSPNLICRCLVNQLVKNVKREQSVLTEASLWPCEETLECCQPRYNLQGAYLTSPCFLQI